MENLKKIVLSADEIIEELEETSSASLVGSYNSFANYVKNAQFTCMEDALYSLYLAGLVDGCVA
jgi:hypothetical protein